MGFVFSMITKKFLSIEVQSACGKKKKKKKTGMIVIFSHWNFKLIHIMLLPLKFATVIDTK